MSYGGREVAVEVTSVEHWLEPELGVSAVRAIGYPGQAGLARSSRSRSGRVVYGLIRGLELASFNPQVVGSMPTPVTRRLVGARDLGLHRLEEHSARTTFTYIDHTIMLRL